MPRYEYKVVPAPRRGEKARGLRTTEERFAQALTTLMNSLGRDGWDYVRADTLPVDERAGLTGTKTSFQNMLVFRRQTDTISESHPARAELVASKAVPSSPTASAAAFASAPPPPPMTRPATDAAAAAAAAAALTAYRKAAPNAPKLGPAPERRPERD